MSESDIYKKREPMPAGKASRSGPRRRRRKSNRPFDDKQRKRRSRNSGLRRILHLTRKSENERYFWWTVGTGLLVLVVTVALWQFVFQKKAIREEMENSPEYPASVQEKIPEYPKSPSSE